VAQKVSRRGKPLAHFGVPQAVEQHLHRLVDRQFNPGSGTFDGDGGGQIAIWLAKWA
jgi:hypothetical protein